MIKKLIWILLLFPAITFSQTIQSNPTGTTVVGDRRMSGNSVILEAKSTSKGFLPPRMTTVQRDSMTPIAGLTIFNTTLKVMQHYDGAFWLNENTVRDTFPIATFGGGSGAARDTSLFTTSAIYGSFYNDGTDTIVVTSLRIGLQGTTPSIVVDVIYGDTLNVVGNKLVGAGSTATDTTVGTSVTSFDRRKIPPGNWVWVKTPTVTTKPTYMSITIVGYKKRKV